VLLLINFSHTTIKKSFLQIKELWMLKLRIRKEFSLECNAISDPKELSKIIDYTLKLLPPPSTHKKHVFRQD